MTRNHVKTDAQWAWLVNHPCNVVLRHHGNRFCKHEAGTGGDEILTACAKQIVSFEGRENVFDYLRAMAHYYPVSANRQLQRLEALL